MKTLTSTPKPCPTQESQIGDADWASTKLEMSSSSTSQQPAANKRLSYKEKFRAKVKTVLSNVRDLEIEEYDEQKRKTNQDGNNQTLDTNDIIFSGSILGVDDDPVNSTNVVRFARKAFLIIGLQLVLATIWISSVCPNEKLFNKLYSNSETFILIASLALMVIFGSLYFSKKVFGSYKTHIAISSAMTLSLGYLYGALALLISYKTMIVSFLMSLGYITGLIAYCKVTADDGFSTRRSSMSGCLGLLVVTGVLYLCTDTGAWTLLLLCVISSIFGIALVFKTQLAAENDGSHLLMKHYVFFAMVLYIDFMKAVAQATIHTLNYKAKPQPEQQATERNQADTHINLFAFSLEQENKCL